MFIFVEVFGFRGVLDDLSFVLRDFDFIVRGCYIEGNLLGFVVEIDRWMWRLCFFRWFRIDLDLRRGLCREIYLF